MTTILQLSLRTKVVIKEASLSTLRRDANHLIIACPLRCLLKTPRFTLSQNFCSNLKDPAQVLTVWEHEMTPSFNSAAKSSTSKTVMINPYSMIQSAPCTRLQTLAWRSGKTTRVSCSRIAKIKTSRKLSWWVTWAAWTNCTCLGLTKASNTYRWQPAHG